MNILFVPYGEISGLGGVELMVLRLSQAFTARGWRCGIVEMVADTRPARVLPGTRVPVWAVTAPSEPQIERPRSWASFARATWQFTRAARALVPDVVHVFFPAGQCLPVVGAYALPHAWRLAVTVLGSDVRAEHSADVRAWQDRLFRRADAVTAVSGSLRDHAVMRFPYLRDRIQVIHNGVNCAAFDGSGPARPAEGRYVLYVGRLHPVKQVDLLLRAWALIHTRAPEVRLRIVGEGPEERALRTLAEELHLGSSAVFEGFRPDEELPTLYRGADAVILPSRREGLPLALLEAGATGTLAIGTNVPGIADVIDHGRTGFLADETPESLGAAILQVLELPDAARRVMVRASRDHVRRHFSEDGMMAAYANLYDSIVSHDRRGAA
jgi:glycosyltransferase involved in cell wall biosynthesis